MASESGGPPSHHRDPQDESHQSGSSAGSGETPGKPQDADIDSQDHDSPSVSAHGNESSLPASSDADGSAITPAAEGDSSSTADPIPDDALVSEESTTEPIPAQDSPDPGHDETAPHEGEGEHGYHYPPDASAEELEQYHREHYGSDPENQHLETDDQGYDTDAHSHHAALGPPAHSNSAPHVPPPPINDDLEPVGTDEDGGGPVKSFLEHMEDLRWVLIKVFAAIIIAMIVCLVASNHIIDILTKPLKEAEDRLRPKDQMVSLWVGTNELARFPVPTNQFETLNLGTNQTVRLRLESIEIGTNQWFGFKISPEAVDQLPNQGLPPLIPLKTYSPMGPFVVAFQVAFYGGIGLASPFILFFIGDFVLPALKRREKAFLFQALGFGTVLFFLGVAFCYFVITQIALYAAVNFAHWMSFGADEWRAEEYIKFVCKFMLGMGISFELPVVILTLVRLNLLDYRQLSRIRPYWVVVNMVFSSMLTPPDPVTMLLMAIPMQVLFEVSVLIAWLWSRKEQKEAAAESG